MLDKVLDAVRIGLMILLAITGLLIYEAWDKDHPAPQQAQVAAQPAEPAFSTERYVPNTNKPAVAVDSSQVPATDVGSAIPPSETSSKFVTVKTDLLELTIDTVGGDIVESKLLKYPETLGSATPFTLLTNNKNTRYIAESGLLGIDGPDMSTQQAVYTVDQYNYELQPGQDQVVIKLHWKKKPMSGYDTITVDKTYTFTRGSYEVNVGYEVNNQSDHLWSGTLYTQLSRMDTPPPTNSGFINLATYFGAAISSQQKPFEKITFKQMKEKNLDVLIQGGWASMIQHYFISAWVPDQSTFSNYYTRVLPNGMYTIGMLGSTITTGPGTKIATSTKLYTGPALAEQMVKAAPNLNLTIDYGWFWFISVAILWMMQKIYDVVGNWGWSIVLVTIIIKALFYKLSAKSYRSMAALKRLQPRLEKLKERYGDDKQKFTQATMDLYRQEKVNPMSGCLPILIQIPVFIALYWVLVESVQLRQAPFIFWIHDLTQHDPYYVLPLLMGISMFIQQRLNPPPPDPVQAKVMMLMPVIFTVLFANFPAGLMLYWFVNNTLSFLQQWYVMHHIDKEAALKKA
ncbi:MAG TPA: membrane protein insertase YidC [Gammaproteobacteria bacterium]|jgi:YidC/Oxa1 family membrane protein insertase|nr:membrane protein insertase YidC [Gammaproteobacteria bacterium]